MPADKQIQASRANGPRSRGPVTARGKDNSNLNNLRHGMLAQTVVLEGESRALFDQLLEAITAEIKPRTPIEVFHVETMAIARWRQMRVWGIETAAFDIEIARPENATGSPPDASEDSLLVGPYLRHRHLGAGATGAKSSRGKRNLRFEPNNSMKIRCTVSPDPRLFTGFGVSQSPSSITTLQALNQARRSG
ncbi:MAG: hypothetical protein JO307_10425 [Bryobacterales bacterium]|nr:hypothetical protein [Bryobacterales bacterium]